MIKKLKNGFKVCKKEDENICFSKKPLTKTKAIKQMKAIGISERKIGGALRCPPERIYDPNKEYKGTENVCIENKDGSVEYVDLSKIGEEPCFVGKIFKGSMQPHKCKELNKQALAEWEKEKHPENYYFFRPALKTLTKVGDVLTEITPMPPVIGDIVKSGYKYARERTRKGIEGYGKPSDINLYNKIKEEVYKKNPKHSLYRSALIQKIYQSEGGKYENDKLPKMNVDKWFKQKWITLNDFLRGEIVPCGTSDTETKYNEYPLCRPEAIAKKLSKSEIKKMIEAKNKLEEKPLLTEKILKRSDLNIKNTLTGLGKDKFILQLEKIGLSPETYLEVAKRIAKREGYDPEKLQFAMNNDNKLMYESPEGKKYFGKANYNDYIIYCFLESQDKILKGYANMKRNVFRKSHGAMSKKYNLGKYSPNELAINILW